MGDEQTQAQLQTELATLQEDWENLQGLLEKRTDITNAIIQVLLLPLSQWETAAWGRDYSIS
jgi:hypothetical protein